MNRIKKFLHNKTFAGTNLWYRVTHPFKTVVEVPRYYINNASDFIHRGRYGYAHSDTYSLDSYLLSWLPEAIKELREETMGYPTSLHKELGFVLADGYNPNKEQSKEAMAEWNRILLIIEEGLRVAAETRSIYPDTEYQAEIDKKFFEAWTLMGKWFNAL